MNEDLSRLSKLIANCNKLYCPLYTRFFDKENAQSSYRISQFEWSSKYSPSKISIKNESFGAKLAIIMESPPPKFNEYFYGEEGGLYDENGLVDKEEGLFACILKALIKSVGQEVLEGPTGHSIVTDKMNALKWVAEQGIVIIDASKCRFKISDAFNSDKISSAEMRKSFNQCSEILEIQLRHINPYKIVVGIANVYDSEVVDSVVSRLGFNNRFIKDRILSPFHGRSAEFIDKISNIITDINKSFQQSI